MVNTSAFYVMNFIPLILVLSGVLLLLFGWKIRKKLIKLVSFFFGGFIASILLFGLFYQTSQTYKLASFIVIILTGFFVSEVLGYKDKIGIGCFGILLGLLLGSLILNNDLINPSMSIKILKSLFLGENQITSLRFFQNLINPVALLPAIFLGFLFFYRESIGEKTMISFIAASLISTGFSISKLNITIIWNQGVILSDLFFLVLIAGFSIQFLIGKITTKENQKISFEEIKRKKEDEPTKQTEIGEDRGKEIGDFSSFAEENDFNF